MDFDVLFLHPPTLIDFRKRVWFPGPVARTVRSTPIFTAFPIGLMSIADRLDRKGYEVKIVNIAEKMLLNPKFEVSTYLEDVDSRIFGIDLHWCVHVQGALELGRLCKEAHPESLVILGGLTATCFKEEILQKYPFIDAVMAGESEEAMVKLLESPNKFKLDDVPNIVYRSKEGRVKINEIMLPREDLDEYEFTRIDLIEKPTQIFYVQIGGKKLKIWHIPVCRGCLFNCATCGGSCYSYKRLFSRDRPAFRGIDKIVEDFHRLDEQGFNSVFLFQDIRMGGSNYWKNLLKTLHKQRWSHIEHVTMELFYPLNHEFIKTLYHFKPADKFALTMSPESGDEHVRKRHGKNYSNELIIETAESCGKFDVPVTFFFMGVLAHETWDTVKKMPRLWEKLLSLKEGWVDVEYGPMIILDPGSLAFHNPNKVGYSIRYGNLSLHHEALSKPLWVDWINYETKNFHVEDIRNIILDSIEQLIILKWRWGRIDGKLAELELKNIAFNKLLIEDIKRIQHKNSSEKERLLKELKEIQQDPFLTESYILTHE